MKKLLLVLCLCVGLSARAQFTWGVQAGVNVSDPGIDPNLHYTGKPGAGFQAGCFTQMRLFKSFYLRPAIQFINKSYKLNPDEDFHSTNPFNAKYSINYISIPLLIMYKWKIATGGFDFGLGQDWNIAVSGKGNLLTDELGNISNQDHKLKFGKGKSDEFRRLVIHPLVFAGYQSDKGLGIHLFSNPIFSDISENQLNTLGIYGLSLTYLIGGRKK
jgi:hypothetical protein